MRVFNQALAAALTSTIAICASVTPAHAQYVLNMRDADVRTFVADAAQVTGRTFIVDGRVNQKISVVSDRPLTRSEYFEVFLSTLRANGLVAVPTADGAFRIQPAANAASQPSRVGSQGAPGNQMVTDVVRLGAVEAEQAVNTLKPLVSPEGSITANRAGNSLVIVDYADNLRRIRALLQQIDTDNSATEMIALNHAGAREIATALTELIPQGQGGASSLASVVAVDSSNSLLLRGDQATLSRLAAMARELDNRAAYCEALGPRIIRRYNKSWSRGTPRGLVCKGLWHARPEEGGREHKYTGSAIRRFPPEISCKPDLTHQTGSV